MQALAVSDTTSIEWKTFLAMPEDYFNKFIDTITNNVKSINDNVHELTTKVNAMSVDITELKGAIKSQDRMDAQADKIELQQERFKKDYKDRMILLVSVVLGAFVTVVLTRLWIGK